MRPSLAGSREVIRVLLVTSNPPRLTQGGSRQLYYHFVGQPAVEAAVITDAGNAESFPLPTHAIQLRRLVGRLIRTRFSKWGQDLLHSGMGFEEAGAVQFAKAFRPDLVVIGAETGLAEIGIRIARRLQIPLAGFFMDWPTFAAGGHGWCLRRLGRCFARRYRACDLAITISPEMQEALGEHPNRMVSYPCCPPLLVDRREGYRREGARPITLGFSGNLGQWYGPMLARLAQVFAGDGRYRLRVAGSGASWTEAEAGWLSRRAIYNGFLDEEGLRRFLQEADMLLVLMGFQFEAELIERTSFKSKLAEYFQYDRPVLIWGPSGCTAVRRAMVEHFAVVVTDPAPEAVLAACAALAEDSAEQERCIRAGRRFYETHMEAGRNTARIHEKLFELVGADRAKRI